MKTGSIYFLGRRDGLIKVGYTTNFDARLRVLTKNHGALEIIRVINGDRRREKKIQSGFARHLEFGEWFRGSAEIRRMIADLPDGAVAEICETAAEKEWALGEAALAEEAKHLARRLVWNRCQRKGLTMGEARKEITADYGISASKLDHLRHKAITVSAYLLKTLREAVVSELMAHRAEVLAQIEELEGRDDDVARLEAAKSKAKTRGELR
jgi:hypothetical protein